MAFDCCCLCGSFSEFSGCYLPLESGLRIKSAESNSNLYFTTTNGIQKISGTLTECATCSSICVTNFSTAANFIVSAGGPKALDTTGTLTFACGAFLPPLSKTAYRVVWAAKDNNKILVTGTPSSRFVISNTDEDKFVRQVSTVTTKAACNACVTTGDYFLLTDGCCANYYVWYSCVACPVAPSTSETIGKTSVKVEHGASDSACIMAAKTATALDVHSAVFCVMSCAAVLTITNKTGGDVTNVADSAICANKTTFTFATPTEGSTCLGTSAQVCLTFSIPSDVSTTCFFYSVYRTRVATTTCVCCIPCLEPGDEMNLVIENSITTCDLTAGTITIQDTTIDCFRESGTLLYTNPTSGEGILQANEKPPVAKDIELFRDTMFFSNTQTNHRKQINLLSIAGFTSGCSKFVIGNCTKAREYTFIGAEETSTITVPCCACTVPLLADGDYFLINSASNEKKYFFWFGTSCALVPCACDTTGRVPIKIGFVACEAAACVVTKINSQINAQTDFTSSICGLVITVCTVKNGNVTDIVDGTCATGFTLAVTSQGNGEAPNACNACGGDILLSNLTSISQSIDETARSIVNIVNRDTAGIVDAFYLSGENDLPGIIFFESRCLSDTEFFLGVTDSCIANKFSPKLPCTKTISGTAGACSCVKTTITSTAHGFNNNDDVYIYKTPCCTSLLGKYTVSGKTCNTFVVNQAFSCSTTGLIFKADEESDNEIKPNRIYYSKKYIPEAVPLVNYIDVGRQDSAIRRILALRDNLFIMKDDGVYILTGDNGQFDIRLLGSSTNIIAPDSAAVLNNQIFMLSTQGVTSVSDTGVGVVSRSIEDKILDVATGPCFCTVNASFGIGYESDRSYILWVPSVASDTVSTQAYRYNTFNKSWVRWTVQARAGVINPLDDKIYISSGDTGFVKQERKTGDRTDFADVKFTLSVPCQTVCVCANVLTLSTVNCVVSGDVLLQDQFLSIARFNRTLRKLDTDSGLDSDYFSTQELKIGECSATSLINLVTKINTDDTSITYTTPSSAPSTFNQIRLDFNVLTAELNVCSTDTTINNYLTIGTSCTVEQETIVTDVCAVNNTVCIGFTMPIIAGEICHYKGIESVVEYAPQHFGDPSIVKQIPEGTIVFDGNNFFKAKIAYSSDLSKDFTCFEFSGRGPGFYGGFDNGCTAFGGEGSDVPYRHLIPRNKQRCRYITAKFRHNVAREDFSILGIGFVVRPLSTRGYGDL